MIQCLNYRGSLTKVSELEEAFRSAGLSEAAARRKAVLTASVVQTIPREGPYRVYYVPGRIEVLGKHTDYAGGRSLVCAAEYGFCLVAVPRDDEKVLVTDVATGETIGFILHRELEPDIFHWANYPMTVARRLVRNFGIRRGVDVAFASDLPEAAGMSSSSVFIVAMFLALAEVNDLYTHKEFQGNIVGPGDLAEYLSTIENGHSFGTLEGDLGVGTRGGSEDHTAILLSQPGKIGQYSYCPVRLEKELSLPRGYLFVVGVSGVKAEKTGAARELYNRASMLAAEIVSLWRQATGRPDETLGDCLRSGDDAIGRLYQIIHNAGLSQGNVDALLARLEHFLAENEQVIPAAVAALENGDLIAFAQAVEQSQNAAEELLGNQITETVRLVQEARQCGAVAASAFGAGFGGSVWALVPADDASSFAERWQRSYVEEFPQHARKCQFLITGAGPAAFRLC